MLFLKIQKNVAENTLMAIEKNIDYDYNFQTIGNFLLVPVKEKTLGFDTVEIFAEKKTQKPKNIKQELKNILNQEEIEKLTTSFDIIGNVAIVEIPDNLIQKEKEIGEALLKVHKNVKSVFKKKSAMKGQFRTREVGLIAGDNNSIATYKENGVKMVFDIEKAYFSIRLSTERARIASLVKEENVLVMFAGVGPFALAIAKTNPKSKITAIELNPDAFSYMVKNIEINKFKSITPLLMDVKDFKTEQKFDRIIMPLPHTSYEYMDCAMDAAKKGTIIHYYSIVSNDKPIENALSKIENNKFKLLFSRIVRPFSKNLVQIVLDLEVL